MAILGETTANDILLYRTAPKLGIPETAWANQQYIGISEDIKKLKLMTIAMILDKSIYRITSSKYPNLYILTVIRKSNINTFSVDIRNFTITETSDNKIILEFETKRYISWSEIAKLDILKDVSPTPYPNCKEVVEYMKNPTITELRVHRR